MSTETKPITYRVTLTSDRADGLSGVKIFVSARFGEFGYILGISKSLPLEAWMVGLTAQEFVATEIGGELAKEAREDLLKEARGLAQQIEAAS